MPITPKYFMRRKTSNPIKPHETPWTTISTMITMAGHPMRTTPSRRVKGCVELRWDGLGQEVRQALGGSVRWRKHGPIRNIWWSWWTDFLDRYFRYLFLVNHQSDHGEFQVNWFFGQVRWWISVSGSRSVGSWWSSGGVHQEAPEDLGIFLKIFKLWHPDLHIPS